MADATAREQGELRLVAAITARLPSGAGVLLGPGDDAAVVAARDGRVVATTDMLVEGVHFRRDWSSAYQVGRKAAAANLADVAAMGGVATSLLVALASPPDVEVSWLLGLADGLRDEAALVGASVVGGDVTASPTLTVGVTALGDLAGRAPVTRGGARPGDRVVLAGRLGWAAAGLELLAAGRQDGLLQDAHRRPEPPYSAGPALATTGATAMCDVSDGLLADLGHIAAASAVGIDLDPAALEPGPELRDAARELGADPGTWVLGGGDDHALVATLPPGSALPDGCRTIGRVTPGEGVTVGSTRPAAPPGWEHFR